MKAQRIAHELPALAAALPQGARFMALKGYDHYACLRRLGAARMAELPVAAADDHGKYRTDSAIETDQLTALATAYAFVCQYPAGDIDSLGIRWRSVPRKLLTCSG